MPELSFFRNAVACRSLLLHFGYALTTCVRVQFKLLAPVKIKSWAMLVLRDSRDLEHTGPGSLKNFGSTIVKGFTAMGMQMPAEPDRVEWVGDMGRYPEQGKLHHHVNSVINFLRPKGKTPDVIFLIIPRRGAPRHTSSARCTARVLRSLSLALAFCPDQ